MTTTVSSLSVEIGASITGLTRGLGQADRGVKGFVSGVGSSLKGIGGSMTDLGGAMSMMTAPLIAGLGLAVNSAMEFDEAITNIGSVLGSTTEEMEALSAEILAIGGNTRAGPQAVAEAFYDIVGGVADASTHMAILDAAIKTSEAGNADLTATTQALVSTMNSYSFAADQAGFASDVLTRIVGMGVGTMDQFAAALPQVTGLAASLKIPLDDVGAAMAFITTKGFSASQAGTQLTAMMTAIIKPNETMKDGLEELGFSSGEAAVEALGLVDAFKALSETDTAATEGMASMAGTTEALNGIIALTSDGFKDFSTTFKDGVKGATDAAREIQMSSPAAQFDLLKSSVSALAITVGEALLPSLNKIVEQVKPVIEKITEWVAANPELVSQIAQVTLVVGGLGIGLIVVGGIFSALGTIIGVASGAFTALGVVVGLVGWPVLALGGAIALLIGVINDPRIQEGLKAWEGVFDQIRIIAEHVFNEVITPAIEGVIDTLTGIWDSVEAGINSFVEGMSIAFSWIQTNVLDPIKASIDAIKGALDSLVSGLGAYAGAGQNLGAALSAGATPGDFLSALGTAIGQELGIPGAALGANINTTGLVMAHAGERILNPMETAAYNSGSGGNVININGVQDVDGILAELARRGIYLN